MILQVEAGHLQLSSICLHTRDIGPCTRMRTEGALLPGSGTGLAGHVDGEPGHVAAVGARASHLYRVFLQNGHGDFLGEG